VSAFGPGGIFCPESPIPLVGPVNVPKRDENSEHSTRKAMIVMAFAQTRASRNGRLNGLGRMVVMGGLEPPTSAL